MELEPLALSISFLDIYCPIPTKIRIGSTQDIRMEITGDTCSTISPEKLAPESCSRWVQIRICNHTGLVNVLIFLVGKYDLIFFLIDLYYTDLFFFRHVHERAVIHF